MVVVERARTSLRRDSGTVAADSVFLAYEREFRDEVALAAARFNSPEFQADIWPTGAAAQARWRAQQRRERRPTPEETARADSIVAVLRTHGVWASHEEGDTYFAADVTELSARLGPYLTDGMRDYLRMQAVEQRQPAASDAALTIELDELTRRIQWAEQHLRTYPASFVHELAQSRYRWYLTVYLAGLPNTSPFDRETRTFNPAWRAHMEQYVAAHMGSTSAERVSRYLALLTLSNFRRNAEIDAFVERTLKNGVAVIKNPAQLAPSLETP
jgi:hypothetical protein